MSFTRFAQTAVAILGVVALGIVATACGDDDDVDGDATTPTPGVAEAEGLDGFFAFAPTLDSALRSGNADFVTARVHATDGKIQRSLWKSEWQTVASDAVVKELADAIRGAKKDKSDAFGTGEARLHATNISGGHIEAILTSIVTPPADAGGPSRGDVRAAFLTEWQFHNGKWMVTSLMSAYTLAEELLLPAGDGVFRLPWFTNYKP